MTYTEATCTRLGVITYTCENCHITKNEVGRLEHSFDEGQEVLPTCLQEGYIIYTCENCHLTKEEPSNKDKLTHHYDVTESVEADCLKDGYKIYTCENCDDSYEEVIKATGHDYKSTIDDETGISEYQCSKCLDIKYYQDYLDTKKISKSEGKYLEEFPVKVKETGIYKVAFKYENGGESHSSLSNNLLSETYTYNYFSSAEKDEEGYNKNIYYAYLEKDKINTLSLKADSEAIITGIRLNLERKVDAASSLGKTGWTNVNSASGIKALQINYNNQDVQWISTAGKEEINLGNQTIVGGYARQTKAQDLVIEKDGYYDISYFGLGKGNSEIYIGLTNKETSTTINMLSYGLTSATTNFKKEGLWNGKGYDMLYLNNLYEYEGFEFTEAVNDKGKKYQNYIGNQKQQAIYLTKGTYYLTVSSVTSAYSSADRVFFGGSVFTSFVGE